MRRRVAGWPKFGLLPKKREHIHSFIINVSGLKTNSKAKMYSRSSMLHSLGLLSVVALYFEGNPEFLFPVVNGFAVESFEFLFFFFTFFFLINPGRTFYYFFHNIL